MQEKHCFRRLNVSPSAVTSDTAGYPVKGVDQCGDVQKLHPLPGRSQLRSCYRLEQRYVE